MFNSIESNATTNIRAPLDGFNKLYNVYNDILGSWTIKSSATTNITASLEALYKVYDDILGYWTNACLSEYQSSFDVNESISKFELLNHKQQSILFNDLYTYQEQSKKQAFIIDAWRSILDYIDHNSIIYDSTNKEYIKNQQILWNKVQDIVKEKEKEKVKEKQSGQITPQILHYHQRAFKEVLEIITDKIKLLIDQEQQAVADRAYAADKPNRDQRQKEKEEYTAKFNAARKEARNEAQMKIAKKYTSIPMLQKVLVETVIEKDYDFDSYRAAIDKVEAANRFERMEHGGVYSGGSIQRRKPKTRRKKH
jgi:hypothetical protein